MVNLFAATRTLFHSKSTVIFSRDNFIDLVCNLNSENTKDPEHLIWFSCRSWIYSILSRALSATFGPASAEKKIKLNLCLKFAFLSILLFASQLEIFLNNYTNYYFSSRFFFHFNLDEHHLHNKTMLLIHIECFPLDKKH